MAKETKAETAAAQVDEAAAVEELQEVEEDAAAKRDRQAQKAADLKNYPDDAAPPTQRVVGGETAYSIERLIANATSFTGFQPWEVAGAMHGVAEEYLTIDQARKTTEDWLAQPVAGSDEG